MLKTVLRLVCYGIIRYLCTEDKGKAAEPQGEATGHQDLTAISEWQSSQQVSRHTSRREAGGFRESFMFDV